MTPRWIQRRGRANKSGHGAGGQRLAPNAASHPPGTLRWDSGFSDDRIRQIAGRSRKTPAACTDIRRGTRQRVPRLTNSIDPLQCGLHLLDDGRECLGVIIRDGGENLAVHLDASALQTVDETRIGQPMFADSGIDALDPQTTEFALLNPAVAVGILQRLFQAFPRDAVIG